MEIPAQSDKFTPMQHMLLQTFSAGIPDESLAEIKDLLTGYLARKAVESADAALEGKDIEEWNRRILGMRLRGASNKDRT